MLRINLHKIPLINRNKNVIPWIIWSIAGLYYLFEIILRMLPGTMPSAYMHLFHINATEFGIFTAFYYWSYTIMQLPAGLIVDRFSIRKTLFVACGLCILGFKLIHSTNNFHLAECGRFIIGFGSAFAYVSALKVASIWLPKNHFGLASCIVDSLGMIGAMFAEIVLVRINIESGYQHSVLLLFISGLIVASLILLIIHDAPSTIIKDGKKLAMNDRDYSGIKTKLSNIVKNPQIWLIGLVGCLFYLPSSVIGDVWGMPYLRNVYHLSHQQSSILLAAFFAGWTLIGPFLGALSDKIQKRCLPINVTLFIDALLFSTIIFAPLLTKHLIPYHILFVMFFIIGIATGTHPLLFALAKENYSNKIAGTVVAFTNTLIMLGGLIFQPLVGIILDLTHGSFLKTGIETYTSQNYSIALMIIPLSLFLCLFLMIYIKETGSKINEIDTDDSFRPIQTTYGEKTIT